MTKSRKTKIIILSVLLFIIATATVIYSIVIPIKYWYVIKEIRIRCEEYNLPRRLIYEQILSFSTLILLGLIAVITIVAFALILKNKRITPNENRLLKINRRIFEYKAVAYLLTSLHIINILACFLLIIESVLIKIVLSQLSYVYNERNQENT